MELGKYEKGMIWMSIIICAAFMFIGIAIYMSTDKIEPLLGFSMGTIVTLILLYCAYFKKQSNE